MPENRAPNTLFRGRSGKVVDGRTREAKLLRQTREALLDHLGSAPTITQTLLIERICELRLRLVAIDRSFASRGAMTETESRHYVSWSRAYGQMVQALGLDPAPARQPARDLQAVLREKASQRAAMAGDVAD